LDCADLFRYDKFMCEVISLNGLILSLDADVD